MKPGDVVRHCRSGRLMTVEHVDGEVIECAYFHDGELFRRAFVASFLVPKDMVLA